MLLRAGIQKTSLRCHSLGQALPIGIALLLIVALSSLVFFNTSKITEEKSSVTNTADAAVYSGLVWQARTLNFQAYTNRAMVANQVSIAQLVSLSSWTNYGRISARNLDAAIGWIPPVAPFTQALEQGAGQLENAIGRIAEIGIPVIDNTNAVLSVAQEGVYNAAYVATPQVVSSIVKANDRRYRATSTFSVAAEVKNAAAWSRLSKRHTEDFAIKQAIVNASMDQFSSDRGWSRLPGLPSKIDVGPIDRFRIVKEGSTQLSKPGEYQWRGKDGLSLHWEHLSCGLKGCKWKKTEIPIGWGQSVSNGNTRCVASHCKHFFNQNEKAEYFSNERPVGIDSNYGGMRAYRTLKDLGKANTDPNIVLHIEIDVAAKDVRTAQQIDKLGAASDGDISSGLEPGKFYTEDAYAADSIASVAAGEVYFRRPDVNERDALQVEGTSRTEYGNLFNPYWDVRLIEIDSSTRRNAWAVREPRVAAAVSTTQLRRRALDHASPVLAAADSVYHSAEHYRAMGENGVARLKSLDLRSVGSGVLKRYAGGALKRYQASGIASISGDTGKALGKNFANTSELLQKYAPDNKALGDTLLTSARLQDAIGQLSDSISGELAGDLQASFAESFDTELTLRESLQTLQASIDGQSEALQNGLSELVSNSQLQLRDGMSELASKYNIDEQQLSSLSNASIDGLNSQLGSLLDTNTQTLGAELNSNTSALVDSLSEQLGGLALNSSEQSVRRYADLASSISTEIGSATQGMADLATSQQQQLTEAQDQSRQIIQQILEQQEQVLQSYAKERD
jgi:hypothetical protein